MLAARRPFILALVAILAAGGAAHAGPTVVATAEGQIGETPGPDDQVIGTRFESIRGQAGELILGGIFVFGGSLPPPPAMSFVTDRLHTTSSPVPIASTPSPFTEVFKSIPGSAASRDPSGGDFVAFSFAVDGTSSQTMEVRVATFDETGSQVIEVPIANVGTFPDPAFNETSVAVDDQGRVTVVYTDLPAGGSPSVKARRLDAVTGLPIGGEIPIGDARIDPNVALLDPAGDRLIIASTDFGAIRGNVLDVSGPTPVVGPDFQVNTTVVLGSATPVVAADPATGSFTVVWEAITGNSGDPVNVRARRYDAMGNSLGDDFVVNTSTANAQGQPAAAKGAGGEEVIVWAGDAAAPQDEVDVFLQVYDANGQPIGGEIKVNTTTTADAQDRPAVRFLPEPDSQGRPRFVVAWRDVGEADGSMPNGTGTSYKCFSIDGLGDPSAIFADGFESGDTTSWSSTVQN